MRAVRLRTEHMKDPIGISVKKPFLSWFDEDGIKQTAFEISASIGSKEIWNSGKVLSDEMFFHYTGPLRSRDSVQWKLRLWDENDSVGPWSEQASFELGFLAADCWKAQWIDPEEEIDANRQQPASLLRKRFYVAQPGMARLYITAHGIYSAWINGQRAGDFVLAPGTSEYETRLPYQTIDVTELLHAGENEIEVHIGDGWWRGGNGIAGVRNVYGTRIALLCQLEVDGRPVMVSDESWQASQDGPVRENDLQMGEVVDLNYRNLIWHGVKAANFGYDNLICSNSVPIREQERFPSKLIVTPDGSRVLDFGQNMAGYVEFTVQAKRGQRIVLTHGECLDADGNFSDANLQDAHNRKVPLHQRIEYICKDGENHYKPEFCIFGFQYVRVETELDFTAESFVAHSVYSDMEETGTFTCSDEDVNKLVKNTLWSQKSNFCDIPTDCPTRERSGWSGDAGIFVSTGLYLTDCYPIFRKWMTEFGAAQDKNGKPSNIAPRCGKKDFFTGLYDGSSGWGDACVLIPYALYQRYGDPAILEENYETMKSWLRFCEKRAHRSRPASYFNRNPYRRHTIDTGIHWGEWLEPGADVAAYMKEVFTKGEPEVATAYYAHSSRLFSEIAAILGRTEDEKKYRTLAEKARSAYRFTQLPTGTISSPRQCRYVRPIAMDLLTPDEAAQAAADLNELVIQNNYHLNTGFLSTPDLCRVLADNGYTETAYRLLLQKTSPSWLFPVTQGANTIWESWEGNLNGDGNASLNHYSKGAVVAWLFDGVCGIRVQNRIITIRPQPYRLLQYAQARYLSPVGFIESGWKYSGGTLEFTASIPANTEAEMILPDGSVHRLLPGTHRFELKEDEHA